jgi:hypothetical protein
VPSQFGRLTVVFNLLSAPHNTIAFRTANGKLRSTMQNVNCAAATTSTITSAGLRCDAPKASGVTLFCARPPQPPAQNPRFRAPDLLLKTPVGIVRSR